MHIYLQIIDSDSNSCNFAGCFPASHQLVIHVIIVTIPVTAVFTQVIVHGAWISHSLGFKATTIYDFFFASMALWMTMIILV